ncbi:MAG: hypothetical protein KF810_07100 [Rhizobiaceae bacterium]|nr:hypothetical protein [Rhizobiaceae bacterium]
MPELLPGALLAGIISILGVMVWRTQALMPRLSFTRLLLVGMAGAYLVPAAVTFLANTWRNQDWLPTLPIVTPAAVFLGAWAGFAVLFVGNTKAKPRRVPLWAGALIGLATAILLPPLLDRLTGSYQRPSLRADVNHCTRGMLGQVQPREVVNICDEPIVVGLCLPGEVNPKPCSQSSNVDPGQTVRFDPGEAHLSSLPSNPNGLTVVACLPPARPSRMLSVTGRGYDGVCIPAG